MQKYVIIVLIVVGVLAGVITFVQSYIEQRAAVIANETIYQTTIELQNEKIREMALLEQKYKDEVKAVEKTIAKKVPTYTTDSTSSCEARLKEVEKLVSSAWFKFDKEVKRD